MCNIVNAYLHRVDCPRGVAVRARLPLLLHKSQRDLLLLLFIIVSHYSLQYYFSFDVYNNNMLSTSLNATYLHYYTGIIRPRGRFRPNRSSVHVYLRRPTRRAPTPTKSLVDVYTTDGYDISYYELRFLRIYVRLENGLRLARSTE